MAPKGHLPNKAFCVFMFLLIGCNSQRKENRVAFAEADVSRIPNRVVAVNDNRLKWDNGICLFGGKPFSGYIKEKYETGSLKSIGSYYNGKSHGVTRTFYPSGQCRDLRNYKDNLSCGRHVGFWENGHPKFDFVYHDDKREGIQKQWYEDGKPYTLQTYRNDSENGMQKAWRQNGKLFANYEVKDGICYGLQKTNLCYTLRNEKIK